MNKLINDKGVCRTAPATPGLLNICQITHLRTLGGMILFIIIAGAPLPHLPHTLGTNKISCIARQEVHQDKNP